MNQYSFTAFTDASSATTRSYVINITTGQTFIDAGLNPQYNLYEIWRFQEMFTSDQQQNIIIKYSREFYTDSGWTIGVHIEGIPKYQTVITDNSNGKFTFWDESLGIPLLRKFFANAIVEQFGLPDYFNESQLLGG